MNIYFNLFFFLTIAILFFTLNDFSLTFNFYTYVFKTNVQEIGKMEYTHQKTKSNFLYNYYELFKHCSLFTNKLNKIDKYQILLNSFLLYYSVMIVAIILIFMLSYKFIEKKNKYNYLYLINAFICCTVFYLYYGSYFYKKAPKLDVLIDKHLTTKEKEIYEKTWG